MASPTTTLNTEAIDTSIDTSMVESSHGSSQGTGGGGDDASSVDMGYEAHEPTQRRGSMTQNQERERRASIKAIMADSNMTPFEKRKSIQHLMDGRRQSMSAGSSCGSSTGPVSDHEGDISEDEKSVLFSDRNIIICNEQTRRAEMERPECTHYDRKCTLISPCCGAAFGCRICHDECPMLPPIINKAHPIRRSASMPSICDTPITHYNHEDDDQQHTIDRFAVREVICRECYTRQSSKT
jgi:hypothetical protein